MISLNDDFPDLEDQVIELKALTLLEGYYNRPIAPKDAPIPVERIAEHYLGYEIDILANQLYEDPNLLGGIVFEQQVIQVNQAIEDHDGRYNFTIAHEIGHHVLHRDIYLEKQNTITLIDMCREQGSKPKAEAQADRFAGAILMPKALVEAAIEKTGLAKKLKRIRSVYSVIKMLDQIIVEGAFTNVSKTAVLNRLIFLQYLPHLPYQRNLANPSFKHGQKGFSFWLYMFKKNLKKLLRF